MYTTYITTTLPYANGTAHVGHLFEFVLADIASRAKRRLGYKVFFNTGLDEHGGKILNSTDGNSLNEFRAKIKSEWLSFTEDWNISYSNFYTTSSEKHKERTLKFWSKLVDADLLKIKRYDSHYCSGCESFKTKTELDNGKCQDHPNLTINKVSEDNYFLVLDSMVDAIVQHSKTIKIYPESKRKELESFAENIRELSVSRLHKKDSNLIQSPDKEHDIYVWIDALLSYIFSIGYDDDERVFHDYWIRAQKIQFCGPDNLKFQGVIWQHLLKSANLPLTDKLVVHGTIRDENGLKISKTIGNNIEPKEQLNKFGVDAVRYYIAAGLSTYQDSNWNENEIVSLHDAHLVNGFGNLARRVTVLMNKNELSSYLCSSEEWYKSKVSDDVFDDVKEFAEKVEVYYDEFDFNNASLTINKLNDYGNKFLQDKAPWSKELSKEEKFDILIDAWYIVQNIIELYAPIIPDKISKIKIQVESWRFLKNLDDKFVPKPVMWFKPLSKN